LEIKRDTHERFLIATLFSHLSFSIADQIIYQTLPICSSQLSTSSSTTSSNHTVPIQEMLYNYQELEARYDATQAFEALSLLLFYIYDMYLRLVQQ
jgi:hypothetical protein